MRDPKMILVIEEERLAAIARAERAEARIAELENQLSEGRTQFMHEIAKYQSEHCFRLLYQSERDEAIARAERAEAECKAMAADFGEIIIICREQLALPPGNRAMEFSLTVIRDIAKGRDALNPSPAGQEG